MQDIPSAIIIRYLLRDNYEIIIKIIFTYMLVHLNLRPWTGGCFTNSKGPSGRATDQRPPVRLLVLVEVPHTSVGVAIPASSDGVDWDGETIMQR